METAHAGGEEIRFCRLPQILDRFGVSKADWYRRVAAGDAPAPVHLGKRARAWLKSDLDTYAQTLAGRKGGA